MDHCAICGCNLRANNRGERLLDGSVLCDSCTKKAKVKGLGQYFVKSIIAKDINMPAEELEQKRQNQAAENYKNVLTVTKDDIVDHAINNKSIIEMIFPTPLKCIQGNRGRSLYIYDEFLVLDVGVTVGSVVTGNATDGIKVIFYKDIIGIQFKLPGVLIGYLQFETPTMMMNNGKDNFFNENTFTFYSNDKEELFEVISTYKYVFEKVKGFKHLNADYDENSSDFNFSSIAEEVSKQYDKQQTYDVAKKQIEYRDYEGAMNNLSSLEGYKDTDKLINHINKKLDNQGTIFNGDAEINSNDIQDLQFKLEEHSKAVDAYNAEYNDVMDSIRETDQSIADIKDKLKATVDSLEKKKIQIKETPLLSLERGTLKDEIDQLQYDKTYNESLIQYLEEESIEELNEHYNQYIQPIESIEEEMLSAIGITKEEKETYSIVGSIEDWMLIGREKNKVLFLAANGKANGVFTKSKYSEWIKSNVNTLFANGKTKYIKSPSEVFANSEKYGSVDDKVFLLSVDEVSRYLPMKRSRILSNCKWYLRGGDDDKSIIVDYSGDLFKIRNANCSDDTAPLWRIAFWVDLDELK